MMRLSLDVISPAESLIRNPWVPIVLVVIVLAVAVALIVRKRNKR